MQLGSQLQRNYDGWLLFFSALVTAFFIFIYSSLTTHHIAAYNHFDVHYQLQTENLATISDVTASSPQWLEIEEPVNLGMKTAPYWFRLTLPPTPKEQGRFLLNINYPLLDNLTLYFYNPRTKTVVSQAEGGDKLEYNKRSIMLPSLVYVVPASSEGLLVYLKVKTSGTLKLPMRLWEAHDFLAYSATDNLMLGIFLGILVAIGLSNLFLYITTRSVTFFIYSGYVISLAMTITALYGLGYAYLWPSLTGFQGQAVALFANATLMFAMVFCNLILNVQDYSKKLSKALQILASIFFINVIISFFLPYAFLIRIFLVLLAFSAILTLSIGVWIAYKGSTIARYYSFAWCVLLVSAFTAAVDNLGLFDSPVPSNYLLMLGAGVETLLLVLVLAIDYSHNRETMLEIKEKTLKQEQDILKAREELLDVQQQYQDDLEYKVQERTLELEVALRELSSANIELENLNTIDPLTGIRNRRHFDKRLLAEGRRSRREQTSLSLAIIDIDHFKNINDTYGHSIGDACISHLAQLLQSVLKRHTDDICRYGGEEFVVILPNTDLEGASQVIECMRRAVEKDTLEIEGHQLNMTISAGVATAVIAFEAHENALFKHADTLLYQAKKAGRNRIETDNFTGLTS